MGAFIFKYQVIYLKLLIIIEICFHWLKKIQISLLYVTYYLDVLRNIFQGARGEICGGFSDAAWGRPPGKNHYLPSERAFLFTLYNHQDQPPTQFHLVKKPFAICYHPE